MLLISKPRAATFVATKIGVLPEEKDLIAAVRSFFKKKIEINVIKVFF